MPKYQVNPKAMRLSREWRGLSIQESAELSGISAAKIADYEKELDQPTWGEIERLARVYKVSTLALGDPNPIPPTPPTVDYRTFEGRPLVPSISITTAVEEARGYQEAAAEIIADAPTLYRAKALVETSIDDDPTELARIYREEFGITPAAHFNSPNASAFFNLIRTRIEDLGIFVSVMKVGGIEDDCRGFCLIENDAPPVIVINTNEPTDGARTFSLLHEFAHVLLNAPGVSGTTVLNRTERFCNIFATYFLMPQEIVRAAVGARDGTSDLSVAEVRHAASQIKCSQQALAIRLEELGFAPAGFHERWRLEVERLGLPLPTGFGRLSYPERMMRRLGLGFSSLVLEALSSGVISNLDAFRATNLRPTHYEDMAAAMRDYRASVAASSV